MGITNGVATFAVETKLSDIPDDVIAISKEMMLNAAGVGLAGAESDAPQIVLDYVRSLGGTPVSTVFGAGLAALSEEHAAMVNGTMVHVLDYDETFERRGNHPSSVMFPTVMAIGERGSLNGAEIVEAFAVGCEVSTKIGVVGDLDSLKSTIFRNGWHLSGVAGTIGSVAAAGKLLGFNQEQMENALGLAVSMACGVQANYGESIKALHPGNAAMHGIMAAKLASRGFTGSRKALEAADGYLGAFRGDPNVDQDAFINSLGNPWDVIDPGVGIKYYPCATTTHSSIYAIQQLVADHGFTADDVKSIRVSVPALGGFSNERNSYPHPETGLQGKFSVPYAVSVALVFGAPKMHHFTDTMVKDPRLGALLDRITLAMDEGASIKTHLPSTVAVTLGDGRELKHRAAFAKGHRSLPLTLEEVSEKFLDCTNQILPPELAQQALVDFRRLEDIANVQPLFASLGSRVS